MQDLKGKKVLITGAASGIGRLMALNFARLGANLALVDIDPGGLERLADELRPEGVTVGTYVCDISKPEAVATVCASIRNDLHRLDVLVNNAGIVIGKAFLDLSLEEMQRTMNVNFWGHVYFTKEFLPEMAQRGTGHIVNIASSGGLLGMTGLSDYCASKFAEVGLSETLRRELKKDGKSGVKVTCVCPYVIDTGMFSGFRPFLLNPMVKAEYAAQRIVEAVRQDRPYVLLPYWSIKAMQILKLLPTTFFDWALRLSGGSRAMDGFRGRPPQGG